MTFIKICAAVTGCQSPIYCSNQPQKHNTQTQDKIPILKKKTNFSPATGHTLHVLRWICSHLNIIWLVLKSSFFLFLFANTYICRIKYWMKQCNVYQYNIIIYIYIDKIHTYICRSQNFCSYKNENDCKMLMYCFFFLSLILRTRKYSTKNEPLFVNEK